MNWQDITLESGRAMFMDSKGGLHSVPLRFLRNGRAINPGWVHQARKESIKVCATHP
jgi:hypothetical protein